MNRFVFVFVMVFLFSTGLLKAQENKSYEKVAFERAEKISAPLNIQEARKKKKVTQLIAQQYIDLNRIHSARDKKLQKNEQQANQIKAAADNEMAKLHEKYLKNLGKELDKAQIEEVKNGMTYHTVPITYANYLLMLPYLSKADQEQIFTFLTEGRERAMDAGSSKAKHAWFNNYKGKIANYLSAKGYHLKQEGDDWAKRRNLKSSALEITESNKVMAVLNLTDKSKKETVRNLIAYQYQQITKIQAAKKSREEIAKNTLKSKEEIEKESVAAWEESKAKLEKQRGLFIAELSKNLNDDQIEMVKDEITGQGVKKEYTRFQELLPQLTDEHNSKIMEYLVEARENAMNVLTNRERNQWFAKYRGRANNYLSSKGYDLRKATEELEKKKQN